jgi:competence protein ComEC
MDSDVLLIKQIRCGGRSVRWYLRADAGFVPDPEALIGCEVTLQGTFRRYSSATNPGEFDAYDYYLSLGCGGQLREVHLLETAGEPSRFQRGLLRQKREWKTRLYRIYPAREASILCGLLLGDRQETEEEILLLYRSSGIAHILAISSLHITILGMGLYRMLRRFFVPVQVAAPLAGAVLITYGLLTGMSLSTCRAIAMFLLLMLAHLLGRTRDSITSLTLVACIMLCAKPSNLTRSGFLLSFGCVYAMFLITPAIREFLLPRVPRRPVGAESKGERRRRKRRTLLIRLGEYVLSGICVTLGTLPIQLYFFYEVSRYSVPINLLVLPLMSLLLVTGFFSMMLPGAGWLGTVTYWILKFYEALCLESAKLPGRTWNPGCPGSMQIVLYYLLLAALAAFGWFAFFLKKAMESRHPTGRWIRLLGRYPALQKVAGPSLQMRLFFGGLLCLLPFVLTRSPARLGTVAFLDVGQGDGIVVTSSAGDSFLFDGGSTSRQEVGKYVLKPYLKYSGSSHLAGIFLSHPDRDHVSGALELVEHRREWGLTIDGLYLTGAALSEGSEPVQKLLTAAADPSLGEQVPVHKVSAGMCFQSGSTVFTCLHPGARFRAEDANETSECFLVSFGSAGSLLLTGDVTGEGENAMQKELEELRPLQSPLILKVAHHGSRYSTPSELLQELSPSLAILSAGRKNSYGHPHPELLERLEEAGVPSLCTKDRGAILLAFRRSGLGVRTYLKP